MAPGGAKSAAGATGKARQAKAVALGGAKPAAGATGKARQTKAVAPVEQHRLRGQRERQDKRKPWPRWSKTGRRATGKVENKRRTGKDGRNFVWSRRRARRSRTDDGESDPDHPGTCCVCSAGQGPAGDDGIPDRGAGRAGAGGKGAGADLHADGYGQGGAEKESPRRGEADRVLSCKGTGRGLSYSG